MTTPSNPQQNQPDNPWQSFAQQSYPQSELPQPYSQQPGLQPAVYQQQGYPQQPYPQQTYSQPPAVHNPPSAPQRTTMECKKCHSSNVVISFVQTKGRTAKRGVGLGGHINNGLRRTAAAFTLGGSNLIWKKSEGTATTKFKNQKIALCQNCGYSWKV